MSGRLPWAKFSWDAWETDDELFSCSMAAQGFWMRLLCIASRHGGYVLLSGKPPTFGLLAKKVGAASVEVKAWFDELKAAGVLSVTGKGVIYSRRMVKAEKMSQNGKLGGPAKHRIRNAKPDLVQLDKDSEKEEESPQPPRGQRPVSEEVKEAVAIWNAMAERCDLPLAKTISDARRRAIEKRLKEGFGLVGWREAIAAVEASRLCRGQRPGRNGEAPWKADLDFVCQAKSFTRLREGTYGQDAKAAVIQIEGWSPWPGRMNRWERNMAWDEDAWGPKPGRDGCQVPPEYLSAESA